MTSTRSRAWRPSPRRDAHVRVGGMVRQLPVYRTGEGEGWVTWVDAYPGL